MWRRLTRATQQRRLFHVSTCRLATTKAVNGPRDTKENEFVVKIDNATFYRTYPSETDISDSNPALYPGLTWELPAHRRLGSRHTAEYWAILSRSSVARTTFLQILAGQHITIPPQGRTYPLLSKLSTSPQHAIKYVGFDADRGSGVGGTSVRGAYLSARYESRREETDFTVHDYLTGHTELNALEHEMPAADQSLLDQVERQLNLKPLMHMPVSNLSNGQTRRARIAKALMARPELVLLDGPFMGLDPNTAAKMGAVLRDLAEGQNPRVVISLRPEDGIPDWITHLVLADESMVRHESAAKGVLYASHTKPNTLYEDVGFVNPLQRNNHKTFSSLLYEAKFGNAYFTQSKVSSKDGFNKDSPALSPGEALVEMRGVKVAYGDKVVLGDWTQSVDGADQPGLWWNLHRGQRCGIFGPNGSGKTTMLSLITSDHPQTYSLPIKLFGRSRLPGPGEAGISLFDIQRQMGHSSPEVHAFFPKQLSIRRAIESAWADAPLARAKLTADADRRVDAILRWFARELNPRQHDLTLNESLQNAYQHQHNSTIGAADLELEAARKAYLELGPWDDSDLQWADDVRFRDLSFSSQRLLLFLRAIVAKPDLVILDEALSGIDERVRDKALLFLSHGEKVVAVEQGESKESVLSMLGETRFEGLSPEQALLVISHAQEDVPGCLREWICLPEPGEGKAPRTGTLPGPLELNTDGWNEIWGRN